MLFEGKDYADKVPSESKKEYDEKQIWKAGVIVYLKTKLQEYTDQRAELQKLLNEIAEIESTIASTNDKCKQLLEQIFTITSLMDEMRLRQELKN